MGVKRLAGAVVGASMMAIVGLVAYFHYVEDEAPVMSIFHGMEAYNDGMNSLVTIAFGPVIERVDEALTAEK